MKLRDIIIKEEEHQNDKEKLTQMFNDADESDNLKVYVSQETFLIKVAKDGEEVHVHFPGESSGTVHAKEGEYIVRSADDVKRIKLIDEDEFNDDYVLINAEETPDAEGFNTYRSDDEIVAFQYVEKELLDFNIAGHFIKIAPESYVGHDIKDAKKLIVMSKVKFEKKYRLS
jgi:hypothetical protein